MWEQQKEQHNWSLYGLFYNNSVIVKLLKIEIFSKFHLCLNAACRVPVRQMRGVENRNDEEKEAYKDQNTVVLK